MPFKVKEIFRSFQGEGVQAGRAAVFCRFSGCNLWSGKEEDRAISTCRFCDTDFADTNGSNGGIYSAPDLVKTIIRTFGETGPEEISDNFGLISAGIYNGVRESLPLVIFTGGEPSLQLNSELISLLRGFRLELAIETNGSQSLPSGLDWITVSPKAGVPLRVRSGQELKLIWPQEGLDPTDFIWLDFEYFVLQPLDTGNSIKNSANLKLVMDYCKANPKWRLGVQLHKLIGFA